MHSLLTSKLVRRPYSTLLSCALLLGCGSNLGESGTYAVTEGQESDLFKADLRSFTDAQESRMNAIDFQKSLVEIVGSHYQSCAPLLNADEDPRRLMRRAFNEPKSHTDYSQCVDRRGADFDYVTFSKGSFEPDAGRLEILNGEVNSFQRYNCSGFLAATMAAGGLKYYRSQTSSDFSPRTHEITDVFSRRDSCFYSPRITQRLSLLPGDVINISHGHVIRVLTVGRDPLGLAEVMKRSDCRKISAANMDFTFAHSTSDENGSIKSGVRVESAKNSTTSLVQKLAMLTREMCERRFSNGKVEGTIEDHSFGRKTIGVWPFRSEVEMIFSLRRHVGNSVQECVIEPRDVKGSLCLASSCYLEVEAKSHWQ